MSLPCHPLSRVACRPPTAPALLIRKYDQVQPGSVLVFGDYRRLGSKGGATRAHERELHTSVRPPAENGGVATPGQEQVRLIGLDKVIPGMTLMRVTSLFPPWLCLKCTENFLKDHFSEIRLLAEHSRSITRARDKSNNREKARTCSADMGLRWHWARPSLLLAVGHDSALEGSSQEGQGLCAEAPRADGRLSR